MYHSRFFCLALCFFLIGSGWSVSAFAVHLYSQEIPPAKSQPPDGKKKVIPGQEDTVLRVRTEGALPDEGTLLRLNTQLVVVPFTVTDRQNRYINTLKVEDLRLVENGQEQEVASLGRISDTPLTLALLVDFSGSMRSRLSIAKRAALQFLNQVLRLKDDKAALMVFQQDVVQAAPLTNDLDVLRRGIAEADYHVPTPIGQVMPFDPGNNQPAGTALNAAIYLAVDDLLSQPAASNSRRVIVLLTDGYDGEGSVQLREAIDRAWRSSVSIYAIGITSPTEENAKDVNREVLERLCAATGGRAFYPRQDREFIAAFDQIEQDLRQQYVLSYTPSTRDDSFRTIKIEVKDRVDLQAHHRLGYYATGDGGK